ncbi:MAG: ATP-binding protein [Actinomycetota bacterium]|nr:ATP-binding protein [Actinomycetota bacterium]
MDATLPTNVDRRLSTILTQLARDEPVIAIHGARSVGKSTLLRQFANEHGVPVLDLDDLGVRNAVSANPSLAVNDTTPVCIDEYQRAPDVLDAIKARLNREGSRAGTAVLTGSTRQDALPLAAQSLTGRLHSLTIWPLSQGEISGVREDLVEAMFESPESAVIKYPSSSTGRVEYAERISAGGFPLALRRPSAQRGRWFDDYVRLSIERDVVALTRVRRRQQLRELLERLAGRTAQVLNLSQAATGLGIDRHTAENYARLLEDLFLIRRLPAWGKTLRSRSIASPKVHVVDSGVGARLLRVTPSRLTTFEPTALSEFGHLLETFVVGELTKQASWLDGHVDLGHWRTHEGEEVDLVMERDDGRVLAFEVKAGERVDPAHLKGLFTLRHKLGSRLVAGVALTTGSRSYTLDDRIHVMPIDRLWRAVG